MESKESANPIVSITAIYRTKRRSESGLLAYQVCFLITRKDGRLTVKPFKPYGNYYCEVQKEVFKFIKDNYFDNDIKTTCVNFVHDMNTGFSYKENRFDIDTVDWRGMKF